MVAIKNTVVVWHPKNFHAYASYITIIGNPPTQVSGYAPECCSKHYMNVTVYVCILCMDTYSVLYVIVVSWCRQFIQNTYVQIVQYKISCQKNALPGS